MLISHHLTYPFSPPLRGGEDPEARAARSDQLIFTNFTRLSLKYCYVPTREKGAIIHARDAMHLERTPGWDRKTSGGKGGKGGNLLDPSGASDFANDINHSRRALRRPVWPARRGGNRAQTGGNWRKPPSESLREKPSAVSLSHFGVHATRNG